MADGRRTRWVAHDVYFLDDGLGATMFDRFGATGIALWHGFVAACKKNHVEGEVSFASDAEALTIFGLPGMPLVDLDGQEFDLSDWLDLLSAHKVIRRSSRGRRIKVACTKWDRWQSAARRYRKAEQQAADRADAEADQDDDRADAGPSEDDNTDDEGEHQPDDSQEEGQQNRRSDGDFIGTESAQNGHDAFQLEAQMTDTDTDTDKVKPVGEAKPRKPDEVWDAVIEACGLDVSQLTKSARGATNRAVKELRDVGASPDGIKARAQVHRRRWPNAELTPTSLAKNYAQLGVSSVVRNDDDPLGLRQVPS